MQFILPIFIMIPLLGFVVSLFIPGKRENTLSRLAFGTAGLSLLAAILFTLWWAIEGFPSLNVKEIVLFKAEGYEFFVDLFFDKVTAVYLLVGALLTFMITIYSRYYLHRETGYKRFFNTILFFYTGYNLTVCSGNFETLFIGWEVLGISSFLLIAFYRDRYLPVKNGFKVFSIYRIGDIGVLLAMWLSHHLWHENVTFLKLENYELVHDVLGRHSLFGVFIAVMILISAAVKSAQFPFSAWLPRAMEGPTPSSAIFYSSLSVHIGVFILLRTFPFWEHQVIARVLIAGVGLVTSLLAAPAARVQGSVKAQVAYSSIAQIGIIFIEVAAGLETLALIHFAGNAFLRTYQLLVSPSVVTYLIREQFYNFRPRQHTIEDSFPKRIEYSLYMLSLKEWNLDTLLYRILWKPIKNIGSQFRFVTIRGVLWFFIPLYAVGVVMMYFQPYIPAAIVRFLPGFFSLIGLIMVLRAFNERYGVRMSWILVIMNHCWIALAISFNEHFSFSHIILYLGGVIVSGAVGLMALARIRNLEKHVNLTRFHGHIYEHPKIALVFLLACLGLAGFPITTTFIGEDLIFSHIHVNQVYLVFFTAFSLMIDGLAVIRIYTRVFLGPHVKTYHEVAERTA